MLYELKSEIQTFQVFASNSWCQQKVERFANEGVVDVGDAVASPSLMYSHIHE